MILEVAAVHEERYWYPDDGGIVWVAGFHVTGEDGRFLDREAAAERGLHVFGVAGAARHHPEALQSPDAGPGSALRLRRDPGNPHDPSAIAVHLTGGKQLGWVPRDLAAVLAPAMDAGEAHAAVVLRERRPSPREPRTGVTVLVAKADAIRLRNAQRSAR